jgi:hypothetical protein
MRCLILPLLALLFIGTPALGSPVEPTEAARVNTELVLLIEATSQTDNHFADLMAGYRFAFSRPFVQQTIEARGGIAATAIFWGGTSAEVPGGPTAETVPVLQHEVALDWMHLVTAEDVQLFADELGGLTRPDFGSQAFLGDTLREVANENGSIFDNNGFEGR